MCIKLLKKEKEKCTSLQHSCEIAWETFVFNWHAIVMLTTEHEF